MTHTLVTHTHTHTHTHTYTHTHTHIHTHIHIHTHTHTHIHTHTHTYTHTCTTEALQIKGTACGVFSIFPCINPLVLVQLTYKVRTFRGGYGTLQLTVCYHTRECELIPRAYIGIIPYSRGWYKSAIPCLPRIYAKTLSGMCDKPSGYALGFIKHSTSCILHRSLEGMV